MTDEQRAHQSSVHMGQIVSPETRAKLSVALKGRPLLAATRTKMSASRMGHTTSLETRAKISAAEKGKPKSIESRAKNSAAHKGKPMSESCRVALNTLETRAKASAARARVGYVGHHYSEEERAKMAAAQIGHKASPESKAKMSASGKGKHSGSLCHFWKGGITPINVAIRTSPEYASWRTKVFERDNYTCQECGAHSGIGHTVKLEAHHIHEFAQYPEERFVVENGKTLCLECHGKTKPGRPHVVMVGG